MMMPAMLMRVSRRWCSSGTPALAEELARKIAQQVRLNAEVSPNVEWFAKHPDGPAPLASYMLSRMLIRSQYAGVALNAQRPPSELSGVEAVDERLVRAISLLEQHGEALEPPAAHDLSPETKMERRALADLLVQAIASGRSAEELDSLVAEWRATSDEAVSRLASVMSELTELRAHLQAAVAVDVLERKLQQGEAEPVAQAAKVSDEDEKTPA